MNKLKHQVQGELTEDCGLLIFHPNTTTTTATCLQTRLDNLVFIVFRLPNEI